MTCLYSHSIESVVLSIFRRMSSPATDYSTSLLRNVHLGLPHPGPGETCLIKGDYEYWHYGCDGFNDKVQYYKPIIHRGQ